jgi:signal transduction histidine kinase
VPSQRRLTVRAALTAWYLLVLCLVIVGFSAALYWDQEQTLSAQVDRSLAGTSGQAMALIDKHVEPIKFVDSDAYQHASRHLAQAGYAVMLLSPSRQILARFGRTLELPPDQSAIVGLATIETDFEGTEEHWRVSWEPVVRHDGVTVGYLATGLSIDAVEQALHSLYLTLLWAVPMTLGVAGFAGYGLARLAMRPVDRMTQFARSVGAGDLSARLDYRGPDDELGRLATTLDGMLARLEASFSRERRFVADAAHELRTPLAALKGRLDVVRQRERDAAAYRAALDGIEPEVERLIRLVRDLLMLARLETESAPWDDEPIDVSQLCERIVEQMLPLAHERGLSIALDVEPALIVMGSFDHLLRALLNLLDNAIKYAIPGGQIAFAAHKLDGTCRIRVINDGGPLDAALVARVGDRFLRGDAGRSSDTGGVGLGLAIAAEIARRHHGSLTLAGKSGGGAVAALILPPAPGKILEPKRPAVSVRA